MKTKYVFFLIFFIISIQLKSQTNKGTNLRGRVITNYVKQELPKVSTKVDLYTYNSKGPKNRQWTLKGTTITDSYGFYFFKKILPGQYTIWVNQKKSYNIKVLPAEKDKMYQDLPQFIY